MRKPNLLRGVAMCGAWLLPTSLAAQPMPDDEAPGLEEIVVTAQRREARLQDVPVSVSAFSGSTLEALSISSTQDLGFVTPGLQIGRQLNTIQPFIRGIGALNSTAGEESKTAIYVDGVYQSSLSAGLLTLNNIERIEVLKGPQGTLFGRNAVAGVIQIITKDPSSEPSADIRLGYGNYDTLEGGLYLTGGIGDKLAADLAVSYTNQLDGWGTNLLTGRDAYRFKEFSARSKWRLSIGESTTATLALDLNRSTIQQGSALRKLPGSGTLITGFRQFPGFYNINTTLDPNFYPDPKDREPRGTKKAWGASLELEHEFDWATLVSISAFQEVDTIARSEITALPIPFINIRFPIDTETASQELQLLSPPGAPFKWIGGLYYYFNDAKYRDARLTGAAFGGGRNLFGKHTSQSAESYAAFGQVTVTLGERTNLEAGLRYTRDRRELEGFEYTAQLTRPAVRADKSFSKLTYKASLDHEITDDLMVYALYSRGFKGGLFNTFTPADPPVRPEVMDTFEAGFKSEWLDRRLRLNAAAFHNKIDDLQVAQVIAATGANRTTNAASAKTKGFEIEFTAIPLTGLTVSGAVAYVDSEYTRFPGSLFTIPNPAGGNMIVSRDVSGNKLAGAPKWTPSLRAAYEFEAPSGRFAVSALYSYNSGFFWAADNRIRESSYALANLSGSWTAPNGGLSVTLWGKNLLDEKYHTFVITSNTGDVGSPGAPLTYGVTVGLHF